MERTEILSLFKNTPAADSDLGAVRRGVLEQRRISVRSIIVLLYKEKRQLLP